MQQEKVEIIKKKFEQEYLLKYIFQNIFQNKWIFANVCFLIDRGEIIGWSYWWFYVFLKENEKRQLFLGWTNWFRELLKKNHKDPMYTNNILEPWERKFRVPQTNVHCQVITES